MLHAVVMAGGSGSRLWPQSRKARPKQLLRLIDDRTLLEATLDRIGKSVPKDRIWISTSEALVPAVLEEEGVEIADGRILQEPIARNTAPCIGLAAIHLLHEDPDATMLVAPADHAISNSDAFTEAVQRAESLIYEDDRRLIVFGINPTSPATAFGYIEREGDALSADPPAVYSVRAFREKPDAATAESYLKRGGFYWNAGIFVWKAQTILDQISTREPSIGAALENVAATIGRPEYDETLRCEFERIPSISIDYAVLEKAEHRIVVEAPFDWDDVGGWDSLERLGRPDENGNVLDAERCATLDSRGAIVQCRDSKKVIALSGVEDLVVVDTHDALLIARRGDDESIRQLIALIEENGWDDVL